VSRLTGVVEEHGLIAALKQLAQDLGRTPARAEWLSSPLHPSPGSFARVFGTWTHFVARSGLDPKPKRTSADALFQRPLGPILESHVERESQQPISYTPTLIIPDTHFPFASQRVLDAIYEWASRYKPKRVVQVGDLYDLYAHSKFPRSQNLYSAKEEERLGREAAEKMWATIRGIVPDAECVQLIGNHDLRPAKRTLEVQPSVEHIVEQHMARLMTFEGVHLVADPREEYIAEGVQYIHGYRSGMGAHLPNTLMNTVHGHDHKLGVAFRRVRSETIWELHAGFAGDPEAKVFSYTPQKMTQEMPGFGWLDERAPRAIPV
jgi:hypothetical protein